MKKSSLLILLLLMCICPARGQVSESAEIFGTIRKMDSLLFDVGFNTCDIGRFEYLLSEDFEFYHDQSGITNSKAAFIASIREGLCALPYRPRRELVSGSMEVYELKKDGVLYGAIQSGTHRFYARDTGGTESLTSVAKFTHLWLLENGEWKLARGLSFDHKDAGKPIDEALLFQDREETERRLRLKGIPGGLGIGFIREGQIEQIRVFGELTPGSPATVNAIWNVASMTKPVTAIVALKLINAGKWSLDEPIQTYYTDPDVADDPRSGKLTTRMILSHQSGFPNWRYQTDDGKLAFEFEPGTRYQYSGEGYEYLRKALEAKFGKGLDVLAQELVFQPLGMVDTRFRWDSGVDESGFAGWHKSDGELYETYRNTTVNAADDLLTTLEDYAKFLIHVMEGAGLSDDLYREMIGEQVRISQDKYWGLGWWVDENINSEGDIALVHGGDDIGLHTIAFILPRTRSGLLIFTNSDNGTDIFADVLVKFLGKEGQGIIDVEMK